MEYSPQVKMVRYYWTEEEKGYLSQVIKEKNKLKKHFFTGNNIDMLIYVKMFHPFILLPVGSHKTRLFSNDGLILDSHASAGRRHHTHSLCTCYRGDRTNHSCQTCEVPECDDILARPIGGQLVLVEKSEILTCRAGRKESK